MFFRQGYPSANIVARPALSVYLSTRPALSVYRAHQDVELKWRWLASFSAEPNALAISMVSIIRRIKTPVDIERVGFFVSVGRREFELGTRRSLG